MESAGHQVWKLIAATVITLVVWGLVATRKSETLTIASGKFHQVAHKGTGSVAILRLENGKRELRLVDFRTYPATDLEVRLIGATDAFDNETVENSAPISVGSLKATTADEGYELPDALDLIKYRAVTVWSRKYRVNFTTAPLRFN
jgi:Electron transfer DM13